MTEKIDRTLKEIAAAMSKENSPTSSSTESSAPPAGAGLAGDPNCPHCNGLGYLRQDVSLDHPDFGKVLICTCRQGQVSQQVRQRLFALSHLNELRQLTFENFQPRGRIGLQPVKADSLERAYNQARHYAQSLDGWLLIQGDYGCGKTHLAAAIANFAVSLGAPALFITVPDLLDTLRFAYSDVDATFEERFEEIRRAPLLVMDDFGTQNTTAWAQEKLFQIINFRYINRLPLVVTTNLPLSDIEGRIRSRLTDPELVARVNILAPDYRNPTDDGSFSELSSLGLLSGYTFATFDLRQGEGLEAEEMRSLEKAFLAARKFAEHPKGWLLLLGDYGCGKTHLAAAIANYHADLGNQPIFMVVPDLLDHLRATFSPNSMVSLDRLFERVRTAQILVLDDLGTQSMTPWVREKLYQLFNYRYLAALPTVITTSDELEEIDSRLRSRMIDQRLCAIYAITTPAYQKPKKVARKSGRSRRPA